MHGYMALVQVRDLRLARRGDHGKVGDQKGHGGALWFVILTGNVQNARSDHFCQVCQNLRQPLRIVLFVDIGDVVPAFAGDFA